MAFRIYRATKVHFSLGLVLQRETKKWVQPRNFVAVQSNNRRLLYYPTFLIILYTEIPKSFPGCTRISLLTPLSCSLPEKKTSDDIRAKIYWLPLSFTEKIQIGGDKHKFSCRANSSHYFGQSRWERKRVFEKQMKSFNIETLLSKTSFGVGRNRHAKVLCIKICLHLRLQTEWNQT